MRQPALLTLLVLGFVSCADKKSDSGLPDTWTKDFAISLYSGGGMQDAATNIDFTYDSCISNVRVGSDKKKTSFALTKEMRTDILNKMKVLKAEQIRSIEEEITLDKGTDRMCFNTDAKEICFSESASEQIHKDDRTRFAEAWGYLSDLAKKNSQ